MGNSLSLVIGHHDEETAIAGFFDAVKDADIGAVEHGGDPSLAQKSSVNAGGDQLVAISSLAHDMCG